jgi:hypothetical protein
MQQRCFVSRDHSVRQQSSGQSEELTEVTFCTTSPVELYVEGLAVRIDFSHCISRPAPRSSEEKSRLDDEHVSVGVPDVRDLLRE